MVYPIHKAKKIILKMVASIAVKLFVVNALFSGYALDMSLAAQCGPSAISSEPATQAASLGITAGFDANVARNGLTPEYSQWFMNTGLAAERLREAVLTFDSIKKRGKLNELAQRVLLASKGDIPPQTRNLFRILNRFNRNMPLRQKREILLRLKELKRNSEPQKSGARQPAWKRAAIRFKNYANAASLGNVELAWQELGFKGDELKRIKDEFEETIVEVIEDEMEIVNYVRTGLKSAGKAKPGDDNYRIDVWFMRFFPEIKNKEYLEENIGYLTTILIGADRWIAAGVLTDILEESGLSFDEAYDIARYFFNRYDILLRNFTEMCKAFRKMRVERGSIENEGNLDIKEFILFFKEDPGITPVQFSSILLRLIEKNIPSNALREFVEQLRNEEKSDLGNARVGISSFNCLVKYGIKDGAELLDLFTLMDEQGRPVTLFDEWMDSIKYDVINALIKILPETDDAEAARIAEERAEQIDLKIAIPELAENLVSAGFKPNDIKRQAEIAKALYEGTYLAPLTTDELAFKTRLDGILFECGYERIKNSGEYYEILERVTTAVIEICLADELIKFDVRHEILTMLAVLFRSRLTGHNYEPNDKEKMAEIRVDVALTRLKLFDLKYDSSFPSILVNTGKRIAKMQPPPKPGPAPIDVVKSPEIKRSGSKEIVRQKLKPHINYEIPNELLNEVILWVNGSIITIEAGRIKVNGVDSNQELRPNRAVKIGRDPSICGITLSENTVSRQHLEITGKKNSVVFKDLGSSNGTFLAFTENDGLQLENFEVKDLKVSKPVDVGRSLKPSPDVNGFVGTDAQPLPYEGNLVDIESIYRINPSEIPQGDDLKSEIRAYVQNEDLTVQGDRTLALSNIDDPLLFEWAKRSRQFNVLLFFSRRIDLKDTKDREKFIPYLELIFEAFSIIPPALLREFEHPIGLEIFEEDKEQKVRGILGFQNVKDTWVGGGMNVTIFESGNWREIIEMETSAVKRKPVLEGSAKYNRRRVIETIVHEFVGHKRSITKRPLFDIKDLKKGILRKKTHDWSRTEGAWEPIMDRESWYRLGSANGLKSITPMTQEIKNAYKHGFSMVINNLELENIPEDPQKLLDLMRDLFKHPYAYYNDILELLAYSTHADDLSVPRSKDVDGARNPAHDLAASREILKFSNARIGIPVDPVNLVYVSYTYNPDTISFDKHYLWNRGTLEKPYWQEVDLVDGERWVLKNAASLGRKNKPAKGGRLKDIYVLPKEMAGTEGVNLIDILRETADEFFGKDTPYVFMPFGSICYLRDSEGRILWHLLGDVDVEFVVFEENDSEGSGRESLLGDDGEGFYPAGMKTQIEKLLLRLKQEGTPVQKFMKIFKQKIAELSGKQPDDLIGLDLGIFTITSPEEFRKDYLEITNGYFLEVFGNEEGLEEYKEHFTAGKDIISLVRNYAEMARDKVFDESADYEKRLKALIALACMRRGFKAAQELINILGSVRAGEEKPTFSSLVKEYFVVLHKKSEKSQEIMDEEYRDEFLGRLERSIRETEASSLGETDIEWQNMDKVYGNERENDERDIKAFLRNPEYLRQCIEGMNDSRFNGEHIEDVRVRWIAHGTFRNVYHVRLTDRRGEKLGFLLKMPTKTGLMVQMRKSWGDHQETESRLIKKLRRYEITPRMLGLFEISGRKILAQEFIRGDNVEKLMNERKTFYGEEVTKKDLLEIKRKIVEQYVKFWKINGGYCFSDPRPANFVAFKNSFGKWEAWLVDIGAVDTRAQMPPGLLLFFLAKELCKSQNKEEQGLSSQVYLLHGVLDALGVKSGNDFLVRALGSLNDQRMWHFITFDFQMYYPELAIDEIRKDIKRAVTSYYDDKTPENIKTWASNRIIVDKDKEAVAKNAFFCFKEVIQRRDPNILLPAGETPVRLYELIARNCSKEELKNVHVYFIDEEHKDVRGSVERFERYLEAFDKKVKKITVLRNLTAEGAVDQYLQLQGNGGFDLAILGIDPEGRTAFNGFKFTAPHVQKFLLMATDTQKREAVLDFVNKVYNGEVPHGLDYLLPFLIMIDEKTADASGEQKIKGSSLGQSSYERSVEIFARKFVEGRRTIPGILRNPYILAEHILDIYKTCQIKDSSHFLKGILEKIGQAHWSDVYEEALTVLEKSRGERTLRYNTKIRTWGLIEVSNLPDLLGQLKPLEKRKYPVPESVRLCFLPKDSDKQSDIEGDDLAEAVEMLNAFLKTNQRIGEAEFKKLHAALAKNLRVDVTTLKNGQSVSAGSYRLRSAERDLLIHPSTGMAEFVNGKLEPRNISRAMRLFFGWLYSDSAALLHPVERAAVAFYFVFCLQPFENGNTRVAVLLMNSILVAHNFPPFLLDEHNKEEYSKILRFMRYPEREILYEGSTTGRFYNDPSMYFKNGNVKELIEFAKEFTTFLVGELVRQMSRNATESDGSAASLGSTVKKEWHEGLLNNAIKIVESDILDDESGNSIKANVTSKVSQTLHLSRNSEASMRLRSAVLLPISREHSNALLVSEAA